MKKGISLVALFFFLSASFADQLQETAPPPPEAITETPPPGVGTSIVQPSQPGLSESAKNWIFAGSALALAAVGAIFISLNNGKDAY